MTFPALTKKEHAAAMRHMATPAYRVAVETWRKRRAAGEELNFPAMAKEFGIPIQIILAYVAKDIERATGQIIIPIGRPS